MTWCESEKLLSGIFSLECSPTKVDNDCINDYCALVCQFIRENSNWEQNKDEKEALQFLLAAIDTKSDINLYKREIYIEWVPEFNCAIIAKQGYGLHEAQVRYISLIGLDKWKFNVHSPLNSNQSLHRVHTCLSDGFADITSKYVEEDQLEQFLTCFFQAKLKLQQKFVNSVKWYNRSPGFIETVLENAHTLFRSNDRNIANDNQAEMCDTSRGWSYIANHIGNCWPLVSAVCENLLCFSPSSAEIEIGSFTTLFLCYFELWLMEKQIKEVISAIIDLRTDHCVVLSNINLIMKMLTSVTEKVLRLPETINSDVLNMQKMCTTGRKKLDDAVSSRCNDITEPYKIKLQHSNLSTKPSILLELSVNSNIHDSKVDIEETARNNLAVLPLAVINDKNQTNITELLQWGYLIEQYKTQDKLHLLLTAFETVIFSWSNELNDSVSTEMNVELLEKLVLLYRKHVDIFLDQVLNSEQYENKSMLRVEVMSKEVLIVWICYCLVHKVLKRSVPLIQKFGVALEWNGISYFVLSDKEAISASLKVSAYLKSNTNEFPLFSLKNQDHTFKFANMFVRQSDEISAIWQSEVRDAEKRIDDHWEEVKKKQKLVNKLEGEAKENKDALIVLNDRKNRRSAYLLNELDLFSYSSDYRYDSKMTKLENDIRTVSAKVQSLENEIVRARKPPDPVKQPLPQNESRAFQVLFFLHMPKSLEILSRLTIMGQQMFLPKTKMIPYTALSKQRFDAIQNSVKSPDPKLLKTDIFQYYNQFSKKKFSSSNYLELHSHSEPPEKIGPKDVMQFYRKTDGIWYPDHFFTPVMAWRGGICELDRAQYFINPFLDINHKDITDYFTEKCPVKSLQWIMPQYGNETCPTRGNQGIAWQNLKPIWLRKNEWLELCALRAFPRQQLRRICNIFCDRQLPFDKYTVQCAVKLALFHLGEVTNECELLWKKDLFHGDFGKIFRKEVGSVINEMSTKPRCHHSLTLLIPLVNFMVKWDSSFQELCQKIVEIIKIWIEDLDQQITIAGHKYAIELRMKRVLFLKYGILCYSKMMLSEDDAKNLCEFVILSHKDDQILDPKSSLGKEIKTMSIKSKQVICSKISEVIALSKDDNYTMLTSAVKLIIHNTPSSLSWTQLKTSSMNYDTPAFNAWTDENDLYSINLVNGIVLFNGQPISQLPVTILEHPLYKRVFDEHNFEICVSKGVYITTMPTNGYNYTFEQCKDNLIITEIDCLTNINLQLLEPAGGWVKELPERLRMMHSHWYCPERGIILLRDIEFSRRNVHFVIENNPDNNCWTCFQIPLYLHESIWNKICEKSIELNQFHALIESNPLRNIFMKFEDSKFIHIYSLPGGESVIELPRFQLQFQRNKDSSVIYSLDYTGYNLSPCQQFNDTLIGLNRYLLLENKSEGFNQLKVIIPDGKVIKCKDGVVVTGEERYDAEWGFHTYDVHPRFNYLQARSTGSRLHLAELYAASGSLLPETRMKMTGEEVAMQLLRQCWTNTPMDNKDYMRLENLSELCYHSPGLSLLCYELSKSSLQTVFLYPSDNSLTPMEFPQYASNDYIQNQRPLNVRGTLSSEEERRVLGRSKTFFTDIYQFSIVSNSSQMIAESGLDGIETYEQQLKNLLVDYKKQQNLIDLRDGKDNGDTLLKRSLQTELMQSNRIFNEMIEFSFDSSGLSLIIRRLRDEVTKKRAHLEVYLLDQINQSIHNYSNRRLVNIFQILKCANISPIVHIEDLLRAAISIDHLRYFNPFLSSGDREKLHAEILKWLQFCVLEDKMLRLCKLCEDEGTINSLGLVKELRNVRLWSVKEFPKWLVFEVIGRLQIRPLQCSVAMSIIEAIEKNKISPIMQLNMGEGKTRIILPMLILYWSESGKLVRLNFLSPLIKEASGYLHQLLGATLFECKMHFFPFSREIHITKEQAIIMYQSLEFCKNFNGIILTTPEHRLSLNLKWHELQMDQEKLGTCEVLSKINCLPYIDILDECDELLRIKSKLLYAFGSPEQLSSGDIRWSILENLLHIIRTNYEIRELLQRPGVAHWKDDNKNSHEAFQEFRIIDGKEFSDCKYDFYKMLYNNIIRNPLFHLRWIKKYEETFKKSICIDFVVNPDNNTELPIKIHDSTSAFLLSLRGFLANDLLVHCLMKRNRVDYGIKRPSKRRMAVPFHAIETPAHRAEFSQTDCASIYTSLGYFYDGLSQQQIIDTFTTLLSLGDIAQKNIYKSWYDASRQSIAKESCEDKLDSVVKVDLSNNMLVELLVKYYRYNTKTIHFWLQSSVFPLETMQFPYRLEATSWDIATNTSDQVAGFSGTNDDKILLPSSVSWVDSNEPELKATDGKMVQLIFEYSTFYDLTKAQNQQILETKKTNNSPQWIKILDIVIELTRNDATVVSALIDSGALMTGAKSNKDVAVYLATNLNPQRFKGVVYFDCDQWWVRDGIGRQWSKFSSPIQEHEAFVYFDESRCRGADMKLKLDSVAVLTLGPKMCKDKLMQAAGRMRQLENGQRLLFIALDDVISRIQRINNLQSSVEIKPIHILRWVMSNTVKNVAKWLPEWGVQGLRHLIKQDSSDLAVIPDLLSLQDMYGNKLSDQPITDVWVTRINSILSRRNGKILPDTAKESLALIDNRMKKYGADIKIRYSNFDEECERELEKEVELEEEVEREIQRLIPRREDDLPINEVVSGQLTGLSLNLKSFLEKRIFFEGKPSTDFVWPTGVSGTNNFFYACKDQLKSRSSLNDYLRHIDTVLLNPRFGSVLLLSEREAEHFLQFTEQNKSILGQCSLVSLTYARKRVENGGIFFQTTKDAPCSLLTEKIMAVLQLFQGDVIFETTGKKDAVKEILCSDSAKSKAIIFPTMRGLKMNYELSDLEGICIT